MSANIIKKTIPSEAILASLDIGMYVIDPTSYQLLYVNDVIKDQLSLDKNIDIPSLSIPCYKEFWNLEEACKTCTLLEDAKTDKICTIFHDKTQRYLELSAKSIDWNGKEALLRTFRDVTKLHNTTKELLIARKSAETAIEHSGMTYWEYDFKNNKAIYSEKTAKELGLSDGCDNFIIEGYPQAAIDKGIVHPDDSYIFCSNLLKIKNGHLKKVSFQARIRFEKYDYALRQIYVTVIEDKKNNALKAICSSENLQPLQTMQNRFLQIASHQDIFTCEYNLQSGKIMIPHIYAKKLPGLTGSHNIEVLLNRDFIPQSDIQKFLKVGVLARKGIESTPITCRFRETASLPYKHMRAYFTLVYDRQNIPRSIFISTVNISAEIKAERQYAAGLAVIRLLENRSIRTIYYNLTKNSLVKNEIKHKNEIKKLSKQCKADKTLEAEYENIVDIIEKTAYRNLFDRKELIKLFENGNTEKEITVQYNFRGDILTVRKIIRLTQEPESADIIAFTFLEDITESVNFEKLVDKVVESEFDYIGRIDGSKDSCVLLTNSHYMPDIAQTRINCSVQEYINLIYSTIEEETPIAKEFLKKIKNKMLKYGSYDKYYTLRDKTRKRIRVIPLNIKTCTYCIVCVDITKITEHQNKQTAALEQALDLAKQANNAKTTFLSAMSHDIRTPMNAIIGMTNLALEHQDDTHQVKTSLGIIKESSQHLLDLINDILEMSRIESGRTILAHQPFNWKAEHKRSMAFLEPIAQSRKQKIVTHFDIKSWNCIGDAVRIQRVMQNIVGNALKFSPENATIILELKEFPFDKKHFRLYEIKVIDTGCGIEKEQQEYIFESFYRTGNAATGGTEGSGLGLAITKRMIEAMGGTITVESEVGKGSTFTIEIPLKENKEIEEIEEEHKTTYTPGTLKGKHILLVEDNKINQLVAEKVLKNAGISCKCVENGQIAYDIFIASKKDTFDAILMDVQMPIMNGYESAKAIRESKHSRAKTIPILAMTANAFAEDVRRSLQSGMNAHISKPIEPALLYQKLADFL